MAIIKNPNIINYITPTPPTPEPEYFITFSSASDFTLNTTTSTKYWSNVLEYSTDKENWTQWSAGTPISSVNGKLYMRGYSNGKIGDANNNNAAWVLTSSNGDGIRCDGNIENLLDCGVVEAGGHPTVQAGAFGRLFRGCTALISGPDICSESLPDNACFSMFNGTSLVSPPKISATYVSIYTFRSMFYNCTQLEELPKFFTTQTNWNSFYQTFDGCSKIKISTTQTDEYVNAYKIPYEGTDSSSNTSTNTFANTGGTYTGNLVTNTTYYTSNNVV